MCSKDVREMITLGKQMYSKCWKPRNSRIGRENETIITYNDYKRQEIICEMPQRNAKVYLGIKVILHIILEEFRLKSLIDCMNNVEISLY